MVAANPFIVPRRCDPMLRCRNHVCANNLMSIISSDMYLKPSLKSMIQNDSAHLE
eukprot:m.244126 g.244126  ORF g.244126 m.244126 type:complete len:55 (+) comp17463_c0_seq93:2602-2766(+)